MQRMLQRSVTDMRKSRNGRENLSQTGKEKSEKGGMPVDDKDRELLATGIIFLVMPREIQKLKTADA